MANFVDALLSNLHANESTFPITMYDGPKLGRDCELDFFGEMKRWYEAKGLEVQCGHGSYERIEVRVGDKVYPKMLQSFSVLLSVKFDHFFPGKKTVCIPTRDMFNTWTGNVLSEEIEASKYYVRVMIVGCHGNARYHAQYTFCEFDLDK
jgi:hypothetical protein